MKFKNLVLVGLMTAFLCGCGDNAKQIGGGNEDTAPTENQTSVTVDEDNSSATAFNPSGYYVTVNGFKLSVDDKMDNVINSFGEADSYFEAPSCAFDGIEKTYTYLGGEVEVKTYIGDDKADYVNYVILKNDLISTDEGLAIGDDASKVTEIYGDSYKDNNGSYEYTKGNMKLLIVIEEGKVVSIQYVSNAVG